jgi:hypothetical protein
MVNPTGIRLQAEKAISRMNAFEREVARKHARGSTGYIRSMVEVGLYEVTVIDIETVALAHVQVRWAGWVSPWVVAQVLAHIAPVGVIVVCVKTPWKFTNTWRDFSKWLWGWLFV